MTAPCIGPLRRIVGVSWSWGRIRVRYIWTAAGGRDLDTKTWVTFGGAAVGGAVGWSFGYTANAYMPGSVRMVEFLSWVSGDNTNQGGEEYVEANLDNMMAYAGASSDPNRQMVINCSAHWYGTPANGQVLFQVDYLDGMTGPTLSKTVTITTRYNNPQMIARILVNGSQLQFL